MKYKQNTIFSIDLFNNIYAVISTSAIVFLAIVSSIMRYIEQSIFLAKGEFFGYSSQNLLPSANNTHIIVFESFKLFVFIVIMHIVGPKMIISIWNSYTKHTGRKKMLLLSILILCIWFFLQLTGRLVLLTISNSLRSFEYYSGTSQIEYLIHMLFSTWIIRFEYLDKLWIKYLICLSPYIPSIMLTLYRKTANNKQHNHIFLFSTILVSFIILSANPSSYIYQTEQERLCSNIEIDTVELNNQIYAIAFETEDKLYLTKCEYNDASEQIHLITGNRICINKENVVIEKFPVPGGISSDFEAYYIPFGE